MGSAVAPVAGALLAGGAIMAAGGGVLFAVTGLAMGTVTATTAALVVAGKLLHMTTFGFLMDEYVSISPTVENIGNTLLGLSLAYCFSHLLEPSRLVIQKSESSAKRLAIYL